MDSARDRVIAPLRAEVAVLALKAAGYAFTDPEKAVAHTHAHERAIADLAMFDGKDEQFFRFFESCAKAYG